MIRVRYGLKNCGKHHDCADRYDVDNYVVNFVLLSYVATRQIKLLAWHIISQVILNNTS